MVHLENLKYLGYANGWAETPALVKQCQEKKHTIYYVALSGRCHNRYYCEKCGYYYDVDSSD